ncbi:putative phage abortive infection protein [Pantoea agglomerans]|uniref:putative phage abortive infection protein n=1 Tax=Enterobacter agglomerans TaxID=549 RepID=UPI003207A34B
MEYIEAIRTALGDFWVALRNNTNHTSDISMLAVTALAAIYTAFAAIATRNSTKVSEATLLHTQRTSRRDEFISRYNLLLEQHKEQLNLVKSYLDTEKGKELLDGLIEGTDHQTAFKTLQGHSIVSPYMRVLYHLLSHISAHYIDNATKEDKKKYSSIVRSLIRNDVLFLVAVNASYVIEDNKENDYGKYQRLLRKFDFFEHALFFNAVDVTPGLDKDAVSNARSDVLMGLRANHGEELKIRAVYHNLTNAKFKIPFIVSCIFDNPLNSESLECLRTIGVDFEKQAGEDRDDCLTSNEGNLNPRTFIYDFYGRKYLKSSDDAVVEMDRTGKADLDFYNQLPDVDESYVNNYLSILKDNFSAFTGDSYIRMFDANNNVSIMGQSDFWEPCTQFLSWEKHLKSVASGDADRKYIQREKQRLSDFQRAVLSQRLMA